MTKKEAENVMRIAEKTGMYRFENGDKLYFFRSASYRSPDHWSFRDKTEEWQSYEEDRQEVLRSIMECY